MWITWAMAPRWAIDQSRYHSQTVYSDCLQSVRRGLRPHRNASVPIPWIRLHQPIQVSKLHSSKGKSNALTLPQLQHFPFPPPAESSTRDRVQFRMRTWNRSRWLRSPASSSCPRSSRTTSTGRDAGRTTLRQNGREMRAGRRRIRLRCELATWKKRWAVRICVREG